MVVANILFLIGVVLSIVYLINSYHGLSGNEIGAGAFVLLTLAVIGFLVWSIYSGVSFCRAGNSITYIKHLCLVGSCLFFGMLGICVSLIVFANNGNDLAQASIYSLTVAIPISIASFVAVWKVLLSRTQPRIVLTYLCLWYVLLFIGMIGASIYQSNHQTITPSYSHIDNERETEVVAPEVIDYSQTNSPKENKPDNKEITDLRPEMKCSDAVKSTHLLFWMFGDIDDMGQYATIIVSDNTAGKVYKTNIVFYGQSGSEHLTASGREKVDEAWANAALEIGGLTPSDFKNSAIIK